MTAQVMPFRADVSLDMYNDTENFDLEGYARFVLSKYREALIDSGYTIVDEGDSSWQQLDDGFRSLVADFSVTGIPIAMKMSAQADRLIEAREDK